MALEGELPGHLPALQEGLEAPGAAHPWWSQPPVSTSTGNNLTAGIVALEVNCSQGGDVPVGLSLGHTDVFPASPQPHLFMDKSQGLVCLLLSGEALWPRLL